MSLDIDWSLLTSPCASSSSLSSNLITKLNAHLASTSRPSFIGPISIAAFDFGSAGPSVEIRDVRDVWRAFDEGDEDDDEGDAEGDGYTDGEGAWNGRGTREQSFDSYESDLYKAGGRPRRGSRLDGEIEEEEEEYEMLSPTREEGEDEYYDDEMDENVSVYSGMSPRYGVAAVGVGMGFGLGGGGGGGGGGPSSARLGRRQSYTPQRQHRPFPTSRSISQSLFSPPLPQSSRPLPKQKYRPNRSAATHQQHLHTPPDSLPPSPPARMPGGPRPTSADSASSGVPSLQLHVHIAHASDITLTLLTSLQVNYPSSLFMSLPLKLCVTGLTIDADLVLAYANSGGNDGPAGRKRSGGEKGKVHICITDEDPSSAVPVGQRIIPNVQIESEIGDGDVHVLRNVGKVERFIVEALRKTVVDELVFPNFHTVVL
ncbi:putative mitochondrion organization and biogenesis-related protein [Dioszegia hungarica]|uniref:Mitochondrial distribution and morphology protein 12 n=1 Tax=Dioszegia hungarica TaxID=4972 RepID=A0AA38H882_9TREE|nr:putative mitochondrion organization and biogenesis-related protein [Dioszegia hungarica]KAI9635523.1 putative mitochondrion organization and biogenesis-related protein [Dioszegia hungarica]